MSTRSLKHAQAEAAVALHLGSWRMTQNPKPIVASGEARVRLFPNQDSFVGIDVLVAAHDHPVTTVGEQQYLEGPPLLAVEILSPSDTHGKSGAKLRMYAKAGVKLIWQVNVEEKTIKVYHKGSWPYLVACNGNITGEDVLLGLQIPVAQIFE